MPPVFGPGVAVADALEVLRRRERHAPSGRRRTARAARARGRVSPSSITSVRPASPNASPERYARTASRASASDSVTTHALARGEPVGLHDVEAGRASRGTRARRLPRRRRTCACARGRHARAPRARPSSTPSNLRAGAAAAPGPNARRPRALHRVDDARDERLLGADDHEVGVDARRRARRPPSGSVGVDRHALAERRPCPGCPGARDDLVDRRRAREPPRERVLAPAGPDDEDALRHGSRGAGQHDRLVARRARRRRSSRARRRTPR